MITVDSKEPQESSTTCCCMCEQIQSDGQHTLEKIDKHKSMINVKSKRMRYLFKKAIELSKMCEMQVLIVVKDDQQDRVTMYRSGKKDSLDGKAYSAEEALSQIQERRKQKKNIKVFTDDDYAALDTSQYTLKRQQMRSIIGKKRGRPRKNPEDKARNKNKTQNDISKTQKVESVEKVEQITPISQQLTNTITLSIQRQAPRSNSDNCEVS